MRGAREFFVRLGLLVLLVCVAGVSGAESPEATDQAVPGSPVGVSKPDAELNIEQPETISAVIYPFQSATVSTEVRGIVDVMKFREGESVKKGAVVSEISKERYTCVVGEFRGNYEAVCRALAQAKENLLVQESLYERRANMFQDVVKARSEVSILEARKSEAEFKMKQAELNLKACVVRAPFSGIIGVLYREPFEAADNLEKLFELVDTSKVYARANWPEDRLSEIALGKKMVFKRAGQTYEGVLDRISKLIDPASRSKRIHVLIDNPSGELEVGMSGMLQMTDQRKVSSLPSQER